MEIVGYFASLIIGISLGLIGGGGSILTVPVLVYLLGIDPVTATAYSLFIVGFTSLVGAVPKYKQGEINLKTAVIFGIPSVIAVYLTRRWIVPAIPETLFTIGNITFSKPLLLMVLFAILMVAAAFSMIKQNTSSTETFSKQEFNYPLILVEGLVVGVVTGLVGAGGGFLIIPALVLLSKLPMKQAVGTSLLIIAAKSLLGFTGDIGQRVIDWPFLLLITTLATGGIFIGNILSSRLSAASLKTGFGWVVLVMGTYILLKELL